MARSEPLSLLTIRIPPRDLDDLDSYLPRLNHPTRSSLIRDLLQRGMADVSKRLELGEALTRA
jgi:hypothetical protein